MQNNDLLEIIKKKAQFYFSLNLNCHVKLYPTGFLNGKIVSEFIEEGQYYKFVDSRRPNSIERLFLFQIFDIKDYEEEVEE